MHQHIPGDHAEGDYLLHVTRINATRDERRYVFYDEREDVDFDGRGPLYRSLVEEYGRCTGKVHQDVRVRLEGGGERWETRHVGWVFVKREPYGGNNWDGRTYLAETWVAVERVISPATPTTIQSVAL